MMILISALIYISMFHLHHFQYYDDEKNKPDLKNVQ
ncbi:unnamed protein product [Schistosoma margrebowiei]|uniref:Uncharacterized protein n=1 Tax=Schistosoma margrebowiei TaxID=48269 RepID=A0A183LUC3_9TREM|nr:unnamed protein product [Schistosoma margrebowiei]